MPVPPVRFPKSFGQLCQNPYIYALFFLLKKIKVVLCCFCLLLNWIVLENKTLHCTENAFQNGVIRVIVYLSLRICVFVFGLRCLKPGQKFQKFNSDHFPFFKNLNPTSGSKVSVAGRSGRSGRSGNGLRCLEPCQKFRKFNSDHFPFFKNLYRTSASRVSLPAQKITSWRGAPCIRMMGKEDNFVSGHILHFSQYTKVRLG